MVFLVEDILEAIDRISAYTTDETFESFSSKSMKIDAVLHNFTVIGEASSKIPEEIKIQYPDIEWRKMTGFRNIIVHEYFGILLSTVWDTIRKNLPHLKEQIKRIRNR